MSPIDGAADRRIGAQALARVLGSSWSRGGPAYGALADGLARAVLDGSLPLRTRLPSERELADVLGVSRTTTAAAYQSLRDRGFLLTRRGSGSTTTLPAAPSPADRGHGLDTGVGAVDLTIAAPEAPVELHAATLRALEGMPAHLAGTGYTQRGLLSLREALADRYAARGTPTTPDEILVTSGAQQAISLLMTTLVGPGDRVVVEHPTYPNALGAVRAAGARPVPVPVGQGLDVELLESTVRQTAPRLVYLVPDHHNPTGLSLGEATRARVRDVAARHRTVVVADETLTDLTLDGPTPPSFCGGAPHAGLVAIGSASKTFWGGLRVGWVRGHRDLVARLAAERASHDIGTAVLDQLVVLELLGVQDAVLTRRREELRVRRDTLLEAAQALPWVLPRPAGGLSVWADLGVPTSSALAAVALRHGVRVAPGPAFGLEGAFESRLRLTFSQPVDTLRRGVEGLTSAWSALGVHGGGPAPVEGATGTVV